MRARGGQTLIEAIAAFAVLIVAITVLYSALVMGTNSSAESRARLTAMKFAEMQVEEVAKTDYASLPPEVLTAHTVFDADKQPICSVELSRKPIEGSVRVWLASGKALDTDYSIDYTNKKILLSPKVSGRQVVVSYACEYPRHVLRVVPDAPPYKVKLTSGGLREVGKVVDVEGKAVPVIVNKDDGSLSFRALDSGKTVRIEFRGKRDSGRMEGRFLSDDLSTESPVDKGVKLIRLRESWAYGKERKKVDISYVRAE